MGRSRLLLLRARARAGLLASAAATVAVALATVCLVVARLGRAVADAGDPPPPGVPAAEVAAQVERGAAALASAAPALVLMVAILAATAVAQLARLVTAAREHETITLRARGFSSAQAWVTDAAEGALVTVAGAVLGVPLAAVLAAPAGASAVDVVVAWPWALATGVVLAIVFAVSLRRGARGRASARVTRATTAAAVVSVLLASALVVWQLPLARSTGFDPIVAVAPAVVLMAGALVALALFGLAAIAAARPAAALPAVQPSYPARQVARRIPIYAVAVLLVALTVAQAVFASAYSATWTAMTTDSAAVRAGADLRVDLSPQAATPADVGAAGSVPGVTASAPALLGEVEIGDDEVSLAAVPVSSLAVVSAAGGLVDRAAVEAAAETDGTVTADPVPLGEGASGLRVSVRIAADHDRPSQVTLVAVLLDATGTPLRLRLEGEARPDADGSQVLTAEAALPDGTTPWRLLAIGVGRVRSPISVGMQLTLASVEAVGGGRLEVEAEAALEPGTDDIVLWLADGGQTGGGGTDAAALPVAVVASRDLTERLGIAEGGAFEFRYAGTGRRGSAVVSSIAEVVPGAASSRAFFAPLETLLVSQLQRDPSFVSPNSVWAAGDAAARDGVSAVLGDRPVMTAAPDVVADVVRALVPGWWIATAGATALALVAAFAIVQTLAIARRRELGVLRALGITAAAQGRMRAAELSGVFGGALVLGGVVGLLASWLIVPDLVRAVTPGILSAAGGTTFSGVPLGVALLALTAGLAVSVVAASLGVARAARTQTVTEESR